MSRALKTLRKFYCVVVMGTRVDSMLRILPDAVCEHFNSIGTGFNYLILTGTIEYMATSVYIRPKNNFNSFI